MGAAVFAVEVVCYAEGGSRSAGPPVVGDAGGFHVHIHLVNAEPQRAELGKLRFRGQPAGFESDGCSRRGQEGLAANQAVNRVVDGGVRGAALGSQDRVLPLIASQFGLVGLASLCFLGQMDL